MTLYNLYFVFIYKHKINNQRSQPDFFDNVIKLKEIKKLNY